MKKFFGEFKKFITRGNILDMAVGVIVGGAFTGIVNGLSNNVLRPIINWILASIFGKENGENGLESAVTMLKPVKDQTGAIDLANSIYIDWGAFISSVINFLLIAIVLFTIVRVMNRVRENHEKIEKGLKKFKLSKEQKKELKANGIKLFDIPAVKEFLEKKRQEQAQAEEKAKLEAEEKAKQDRLSNPTTEDLLKKIIELLEKNNA